MSAEKNKPNWWETKPTLAQMLKSRLEDFASAIKPKRPAINDGTYSALKNLLSHTVLALSLENGDEVFILDTPTGFFEKRFHPDGNTSLHRIDET
jgi:hypothetical protein